MKGQANNSLKWLLSLCILLVAFTCIIDRKSAVTLISLVRNDDFFGVSKLIMTVHVLMRQKRESGLLIFLMNFTIYDCIRQGTTVRVEFGDATTAADPLGAHTISRAFPYTYGQPLVHFLRATAKVPDAQIITDHPAVRYAFHYCIKF